MSKRKIRPERDALFDELEQLSSDYDIPDGALTFDQIRASYPKVPEVRIRILIRDKVRSGQWRKARRGQHYYYWAVS